MTVVIWYYVITTILMLIGSKGEYIVPSILWPIFLPLGALVLIIVGDTNEKDS